MEIYIVRNGIIFLIRLLRLFKIIKILTFYIFKFFYPLFCTIINLFFN